MFKITPSYLFFQSLLNSKSLFYLFLVFGISALSTCITPLDIEPFDASPSLVVQGFINDDFGPHNFRISRIANFAGTRDGGNIPRIEGAEVRIIDQNGQSTIIERVLVTDKQRQSCGIAFVEVLTDYRTPETFKGAIGSTYTLEIITKKGKTYRSEPQTMLPTPPIDSLLLAFKELPGLDRVIIGSGVEVFASWQDPSEEENFYFWRVNGIYKIYSPDRSSFGSCCPYDPRDGGARDCWILEKNLVGNELAFSDKRVNGQTVTMSVGLIEDNGLRFADRIFTPGDKQYYVEVEQYRIPPEAFEFNQRVKTLQDINGEIFDPPPLNVRGNIFNVNNPEEIVVGYFGAYSKQTKGKFAPRSLLEFTQRSIQVCGDCRLRAWSQTEIPEPYR